MPFAFADARKFCPRGLEVCRATVVMRHLAVKKNQNIWPRALPREASVAFMTSQKADFQHAAFEPTGSESWKNLSEVAFKPWTCTVAGSALCMSWGLSGI